MSVTADSPASVVWPATGALFGTLLIHAAIVGLLVLWHGAAASLPSGNPPPNVAVPPSIQARLVKLGRPANTKRTRTTNVQATAPRADISLSRTGAAEATKRDRVLSAKNVADDDALRRTLQRAAALGEQGSAASGEGSPDGVEGGEIAGSEARDIDLYFTMLQRLFQRNFRVPQTIDNVASLTCRVRVTLNADLSVNPVVSGSSGDPTFDQSGLAAVRAVGRVPAPPPEIADQVLGRAITVRFRGSQN